MEQFRKCYYVEMKSFYTDEFGNHRQIADAGIRPILYTKLTSAGARMELSIKNYTVDFGYRIIEYQNTLRDVRKGLIYSCKLHNEEHGIDMHISVMDTWLQQY